MSNTTAKTIRSAMSLLLGFSLLAATFNAPAEASGSYCFAATVTSDEVGEYIQISDGRMCEGDIVIPEVIDSLPVREILGWTFADSFVTSVYLPKTMTKIGFGAFLGMQDLHSIFVAGENESYKSVDGVLYSDDMSHLISYPVAKTNESFSLPAEVRTIEDEAFYDVRNLKSLSLNEGLTDIREYGLEYAQSVKTLNIPATFTQSLADVLVGLTSLETITVNAGNDVYSSVGGVLSEERSVNEKTLVHYPIQKSGTTYSVPSGTIALGNNSFRDNHFLETVTFPNGLESIGRGAFSNAAKLKSISVPSSVVEIMDSAFSLARKLETVAFVEPASIESLQMYTFRETALKTFKIPSSVKSMSGGVFNRCSGLTSITIHSSNALFELHSGAVYPADLSEISAFPLGRVGPVVIHEGPTGIYSDTFQGAVGLTSVAIPTSVKTIDEDAFADTPALTSVVFLPGSTVETIESNAFTSSNLLNITIPASVKTIGRNAFSFNNLETISVDPGNNRFTADTGALYNFSQTAIFAYASQNPEDTFNIPSTVTTIGASVFQNASNLKSISMGMEVTTINEGAFIGASSLEEIEVDVENSEFKSQDGVLYSRNYPQRLIAYPSSRVATTLNANEAETIDCDAFSHSKYLQSITLSSQNYDVCNGGAFDNALALTTITINVGNDNYSSVDGVLFDSTQSTLIKFPAAKIGAYSIPSSVTRIGARAFSNITGLNQLTIPATVRAINYGAFMGATNLKTIEFSSSPNTQFLSSAIFASSAVETVKFLGKSPAFVGGNVFILVGSNFKVIHNADEITWADAADNIEYSNVKVYSTAALSLKYKPTAASTSKARITGTAKVGKSVTVAKGTWTSGMPITYKYQWFRCVNKSLATTVSTKTPAKCTTIAGANKASFKVTTKQKGAFLRVQIVGTNGFNSATVFSISSAKVG